MSGTEKLLLFDEIKLLFDDGLRHCLDTAEDKTEDVSLAETSENGVSVVIVKASPLLC